MKNSSSIMLPWSRIFCFALIAIMSVTMSTSCGKKSFQGLKKSIPPLKPKVVFPQVEICSIDPEKETDDLVVTFEIDITGSNTGADGSDPTRENRYGQAIAWANKRLASGINLEHESYALIEFSSNGQIVNGGNVNPDKPYMSLQEFRDLLIVQRGASVDNNGTPYMATINKAREILELEIKARIKKFNEEKLTNPDALETTFQALVIFLSDGQPCTAEDGSVLDTYGQPPNEGCPQFGSAKVGDIIQKVKDLVDIFPSDPVYGKWIKYITLNTGFYQPAGKANPYANELLKAMALAGHGQFYDFSNGGTIDYDQIVRVETRNIQYGIQNWEIMNRNGYWDEKKTEKLLLDSDMDGVADQDEFPAECVNRYSCNGSGVRDSIYYKFFGKSCVTDPGPNNTLVCRKEPANLCTVGDKPPVDKDGDLLIRCEEDKLGTNDEEFDTDHDGIIDFTALNRDFFTTNSQDPVPNMSLQDPDQDSFNNMMELTKMFSPWTINNLDLPPGYKPISRERLNVVYDPVKNQKCEYFKIHDFPVLKTDKSDVVQINIIDQEQYGMGKKLLRTAIVPLVNGEVSIKNSDFKSRIVNPD